LFLYYNYHVQIWTCNASCQIKDSNHKLYDLKIFIFLQYILKIIHIPTVSPKNTMDVLKSVNVAAVQSTWAIVKKDINTHAPNFYVA
jgi:hypothetical protein